MNRPQEVNELYDGTLNEVHHLIYATDISSNDSFTFRNTMKQDDKLAFVDAMEKETSSHENGGHWSIVHCDNLLNKARPIKAIWSFKRKRKPDGELLKHKDRLCAHGGMQQWGDSYGETYSPVVNILSVRLILAISSYITSIQKQLTLCLPFHRQTWKKIYGCTSQLDSKSMVTLKQVLNADSSFTHRD